MALPRSNTGLRLFVAAGADRARHADRLSGRLHGLCSASPTSRARFTGLKNFADVLRPRVTTPALSGTPSGGSAGRSSSRSCWARRAAILLNQNFRGRAIVRSITLIPWVIPGIVAATTWAWMFHTEFGIINYMLTGVGVARRADRLADPPQHGHAGDDRDQRLEALPLRRDHGARRSAVHPAGALRGGAHRWRQLLGRGALRHAAAASGR